MARALPALGGSELVAEALGERVHEPALADPRLAADVHDRAASLLDAAPGRQQHVHLHGAVDQRRQPSAHRRGEAVLDAARTQYAMHRHGPCHAGQRLVAERLGDEVAANQGLGDVADDQRPGLGDRLQTGCDVRRLADHRELLAARPGLHRAGHDQAGVAPDPNLHRRAESRAQVRVEAAEAGEDLEPRVGGALRVVLVCPWIAEAGHHAVAQEVNRVPLVALDRSGRQPVVKRQELLEVLRVQPSGQRRRADQIAEHDGDLAPLPLPRRFRPSRTLRPPELSALFHSS